MRKKQPAAGEHKRDCQCAAAKNQRDEAGCLARIGIIGVETY